MNKIVNRKANRHDKLDCLDFARIVYSGYVNSRYIVLLNSD